MNTPHCETPFQITDYGTRMSQDPISIVSPTKNPSSDGILRIPSRASGFIIPRSGASGFQQRRSQDAARRDNEQLRNHLSEIQEQLVHVFLELKSCQTQVAEDASAIKLFQEKIAELETLVEKQRVTINNQSRAISDPKNIRNNNSHQSLVGPVAVNHPCHMQAPPSLVGGRPLTFTNEENLQFGEMLDCMPLGFDVTANNDTGEICRTVSSEGESQRPPVPVSEQVSRFHHRESMPASLCPPIAHMDLRKCMMNLAGRFQRLWAKTEKFGYDHASIPDAYKDNQVDEQVKRSLVAVSDLMSVSSLLENTETRHCLVAKVINFYLVQNVLKITAVKGFDPIADLEIAKIKKGIFPETPPILRHLMIIGIVAQVSNLRRNPELGEFCQKKAREHVLELWQLVGCLTHSAAVQSWSDLSTIISEAQTLAIEMFSVPFEYGLDFPEVLELFDPETMFSRNLSVEAGGGPRAYRVWLGISPVIRIWNNLEDGSFQLVHRGNVLLCQSSKALDFHPFTGGTE